MMRYASDHVKIYFSTDIYIKQVLLGDKASLAVAEAVGQVC
jgi:hypothetical protein